MHHQKDWPPPDEEEQQGNDPPPDLPHPPQRNPKLGIREMAGEYLREVSQLIIVFALLEEWIYHGTLRPWYVVGVVLVSALFFVLGVVAELTRND